MKTSEILIEVLKVTAIATVSYFAFKAGKAAYKKIGDFEDKVKAAGDAVADTFNSAKKSASDAIEKARKSAGEAVDATKKAVLHDGTPSPETRLGRNPEIDDGSDQDFVEDALRRENQSAAEDARLLRLEKEAKERFRREVDEAVEVYNPTSRYGTLGDFP